MTSSDLPGRLRAYAAEKSWPAEIAMLTEAADFIESAKAVERERLEHEAVTPEPALSFEGLPAGPHAYRLRLATERAERERREHKQALARLGWKYNEARGGFVRVERSREP